MTIAALKSTVSRLFNLRPFEFRLFSHEQVEVELDDTLRSLDYYIEGPTSITVQKVTL